MTQVEKMKSRIEDVSDFALPVMLQLYCDKEKVMLEIQEIIKEEIRLRAKEHARRISQCGKHNIKEGK